MSDDINNLDPNDEGLKQIFGDRFHDATGDTPVVRAVNTEQKPTQKPVDAKWEPAKPDPNWLENLKACVKHVAVFGGLSILFFYWQQTGQMDASAAVPSMCACTALAGLGVGRHVHR